MEQLFSDTDLGNIREATKQAETGHAGEIVPYIVERVDDHDEARWRGATLGALAVSLIIGAVYVLGDYWGRLGLPWTILAPVIGAGLGFMVSGYQPLQRKLLTAADINRRVQMRAESAFLQEQVFNTENRTGILIFIALFEHRAVILADEGIHQKIPKETWSGLVDELTTGIKAGYPVDALNNTITQCGEILRNNDVRTSQADVNELEDSPRVRED